MSSTFDHLCTDVILELLSYFNVHEMFYSFDLLIPHLPTLLMNNHARLHVRSNNSYFIQRILPHINLIKVISLNVPTRPFNPSIFQFTGLRSLVLHDVDDPIVLLECRPNWPPSYLEHLSLHIRNQDIPDKPSNIGTRVLERALQLTRLKHFELHESKSSLKMVQLFDPLNFPHTFQSSSMKRLVITVYCNWKICQSILSYLPNLNEFQIRSSFRYSEDLSSELHFPFIRKLNLQIDGLETDILIGIFHHAPYLRYCKLKGSIYLFQHDHMHLFRSKTWLQLIDTYTPELKLLHVDIKFRLDDANQKTIEMIKQDLKVLNFQLEFSTENGNQHWTMTGLFERKVGKLTINTSYNR